MTEDELAVGALGASRGAQPVVAPGERTDERAVARATVVAERAAQNRRRDRARAWLGFAMAMPPILVVALFVGFPIVLAVAYSLGHTGGLNRTTSLIARHQHVAHNPVGTLGAYREMFGDDRFRTDLGVTLFVTLVSTLVVLALALTIALYLRVQTHGGTGRRFGGWMAKALTIVAIVPQFIPTVIASWSVVLFYNQHGFWQSVAAHLGVHLPPLAFTVPGIIVGQVWCSLPFAVLMCTSGVQSVPDALIDAARDSGASMLRTLVGVVLPLAMVPIIIAATFTAIGIIGSFTVPYFIGPNAPTMLGVDMNNYFTSYMQPQQAIVMAVVVFACASVIAAAYVWANYRQNADEVAR